MMVYNIHTLYTDTVYTDIYAEYGSSEAHRVRGVATHQ